MRCLAPSSRRGALNTAGRRAARRCSPLVVAHPGQGRLPARVQGQAGVAEQVAGLRGSATRPPYRWSILGSTPSSGKPGQLLSAASSLRLVRRAPTTLALSRSRRSLVTDGDGPPLAARLRATARMRWSLGAGRRALKVAVVHPTRRVRPLGDGRGRTSAPHPGCSSARRVCRAAQPSSGWFRLASSSMARRWQHHLVLLERAEGPRIGPEDRGVQHVGLGHHGLRGSGSMAVAAVLLLILKVDGCWLSSGPRLFGAGSAHGVVSLAPSLMPASPAVVVFESAVRGRLPRTLIARSSRVTCWSGPGPVETLADLPVERWAPSSNGCSGSPWPCRRDWRPMVPSSP